MEKNTIKKHFFKWLSDGINDGSIIFNQAGAVVFVVEEGLFCLSPLIFKQFLRSFQFQNVIYSDVMKAVINELFFLKNNRGSFVFTYKVHSLKTKESTIVKGIVLYNIDQLKFKFDMPLPNNFLKIVN